MRAARLLPTCFSLGVVIAALYIALCPASSFTQPSDGCSLNEAQPAEMLSCLGNYFVRSQSEVLKEAVFPVCVIGFFHNLSKAN
jgi:hypothetical protein